MQIGAVILAAGKSERMGKPKILMPVEDKPMFLHSVEMAIQSNLSPIYVVGGEHINRIQNATCGYPVLTIDNKDYKEGMSTSLKLGIAAIKNQCDAVMVFLADQPFIAKIVIETMTKYYESNHRNGVKILRAKYKNIPGHPILFDSSLFDEFDTIQGDIGGKSIIQRHINSLHWIPFENDVWGIDIDTMEDYLRVTNRLST